MQNGGRKILANLVNPKQFTKVLPAQIYIIKLQIDYNYQKIPLDTAKACTILVPHMMIKWTIMVFKFSMVCEWHVSIEQDKDNSSQFAPTKFLKVTNSPKFPPQNSWKLPVHPSFSPPPFYTILYVSIEFGWKQLEGSWVTVTFNVPFKIPYAFYKLISGLMMEYTLQK